MKDFDKFVGFAEEFTGGSFRYFGTGANLGQGARYIDGIDRLLVWEGRSGGRWCAFSYYAGAVTRWARESGREIPLEFVELMREHRTAVPHRWRRVADDAFYNGSADAESRWTARYQMTVTNERGVPFNVRYVHSNVATNSYGEPLVRVYDARYDFTDYGQFVSELFVGTALGDFGAHAGNNGVWSHGWTMWGDIPDWMLSAANMAEIVAWLRKIDN